VAAGGLPGTERSKTGHAAGLRTTLLVTLAASVAIIQMNLLLPAKEVSCASYAGRPLRESWMCRRLLPNLNACPA